MAADIKTGGFGVLFVDDEENILRSLKRLFLDEGLEVFTASSGREGLEILKSNEIAVIVSDQRMPEMSGVEFLEQAKRITPDAVRIVLTGYADVNAAIEAINRGGAFRYVTKPWEDRDMIITVLNAGERYRLVRENRRLTELTKKQNEELRQWSSKLELYVKKQASDIKKQNLELKDLNKRLEGNLHDVILAFSNLIELRDKSVSSHSSNVAILASETAERLGFSPGDLETVRTASYLHDIGKIGVSDIVLMKNLNTMSPEEAAEYMKHPVRGQTAVDSIEDLRPAGILIRGHHEWVNGKGFPDGLKGDRIPPGARIIALADQFDRLRHGMREHAAASVLETMKTKVGSCFDPEMFDALSEIVKNKYMSSSEVSLRSATPIEIEITVKDLAPGMVVSRDIKSGTGFLLLSKGTVLDGKSIAVLKRSYYIDPSKTGVFVVNKL